HERLNPDIPVLADPDRGAAATQAIARGATALVLDDGFQHRQMPRDADLVLVSADLWSDLPVRLLPAGPFREPLAALRRASLIVVTRKAASAARAEHVAAQLRAVAGGVPMAVAYLVPDRLRQWRGSADEAVTALAGQRIVAVSGIGAPAAFAAQLRSLGATVDAAPFADHHAFGTADAAAIAARAAGSDRVVCTLKDAVKLGPVWPTQAPSLWYLSQSVLLEAGAAAVHAALDQLAAR
ncbi:MAG: tetraacyldisaccharide 4'-kinase, partial [Gemmatimonadaceae bacterium]